MKKVEILKNGKVRIGGEVADFDSLHLTLKFVETIKTLNGDADLFKVDGGYVKYLKDSSFIHGEKANFTSLSIAALKAGYPLLTEEFKEEINKIIECENSTFDSAAKNYCQEKLEEVYRIAAEDLGAFGDNISKVYKLDDGFVIIVETSEIDYCYFTYQIDVAKKLAADYLQETV